MKKIQEDIKKYIAERGWNNSLPGDYAKSIVIEAAELLELFQWRNPSVSEVKKDKEKLENLKKELGDVFIYAFDMCDLFGFDAETIVRKKLAYNKRKFPVKLVKGRSDNYFKIKKEYRKKGL